jgi:hypothetical protein
VAVIAPSALAVSGSGPQSRGISWQLEFVRAFWGTWPICGSRGMAWCCLCVIAPSGCSGAARPTLLLLGWCARLRWLHCGLGSSGLLASLAHSGLVCFMAACCIGARVLPPCAYWPSLQVVRFDFAFSREFDSVGWISGNSALGILGAYWAKLSCLQTSRRGSLGAFGFTARAQADSHSRYQQSRGVFGGSLGPHSFRVSGAVGFEGGCLGRLRDLGGEFCTLAVFCSHGLLRSGAGSGTRLPSRPIPPSLVVVFLPTLGVDLEGFGRFRVRCAWSRGMSPRFGFRALGE